MRRLIAVPPSWQREIADLKQEVELLRALLEAANARADAAEDKANQRCFWCGIKPPTEEERRH